MGAEASERKSQFVSLRKAYEIAFREFCLKVHLLQSLASQETTDGRAVEEAKLLVEKAHDAYRESRGLLAQFMLLHGEAGAAATRRHAPAQMAAAGNEPQSGWRESDQRSRVERPAYRFWEEADQPAVLRSTSLDSHGNFVT